LDEAGEPAPALPASLDLRDPLVDADPGDGGGVGALWEIPGHAYTFLMSARPRSPLGRRRMTTIRSEKT
jgi:hypothetical protein